MADVRTFNSYNFVTGAVDGTLAYDFSDPAFYPEEEEEVYEQPERRRGRRSRLRQQEWIREDTRSKAKGRAEARGQGISPLSLLGVAVVVVLVTMMLLAQIQLTDISHTAAELEDQIANLEARRDKLTVEYETIFNLKDVEEIAVEMLGMQEPDAEQICYLTGVASADKAVVVTRQQTDMFSLGLDDLAGAVRAWTKGIFG